MSSNVQTPESLGPELVSYVDWLIERAEGTQGKAELGPITEDLCLHLRALAICLFADDGEVDPFFQWLLHSPLARKHYLATVHSSGIGAPGDARLSFVDPVLDAMASRQWDLAAEIGAMSSKKWLDGDEYQDDFCYGEFLRNAVARSSLDGALERWRRALEGGADRRLDVAEAFAARDAAELEASLRALLEETAAKARTMADPNSPSPLASNYYFTPNRWVSVEGLALLALAEREGIAVDFELEGCPASLRTESYSPFRSRAYPHLGLG
jgi:hypothetical protein